MSEYAILTKTALSVAERFGKECASVEEVQQFFLHEASDAQVVATIQELVTAANKVAPVDDDIDFMSMSPESMRSLIYDLLQYDGRPYDPEHSP